MKEDIKFSIFRNVPEASEDPIMLYMNKFKLSQNENKLNLTIGMIKEEDGISLKQLSCVKKAELEILNQNLNKEYTPMAGTSDFLTSIRNLIFPEEKFPSSNSNILVIQTITGGGSLRSGAELVRKLISKKIYTSNLTFSPYKLIFKDLEVYSYPYYNIENRSLDISALLSFINQLDENSVVNFQVSSHNPTGLDPSKEEWEAISEVCFKKNVLVFFDIAYLGYGNGSIEDDLFPVHLFQRKNIEMIISYSSGKSFMNYSDDIGALLLSTRDKNALERIKAHLFVINRGLFSFSSIYGSRIISKILTNEELKREWMNELQETWNTLRAKREAIMNALFRENVQIVDFLKKQKGIYMYFDLNNSQIDYLVDKYAIFVVPGGRVSISSLPTNKIDYFAKAIKDTLTHS